MKLKLPTGHFHTTALTAWASLWCLFALNLPFWSRVLEIRPIASVGGFLGIQMSCSCMPSPSEAY